MRCSAASSPARARRAPRPDAGSRCCGRTRRARSRPPRSCTSGARISRGVSSIDAHRAAAAPPRRGKAARRRASRAPSTEPASSAVVRLSGGAGFRDQRGLDAGRRERDRGGQAGRPAADHRRRLTRCGLLAMAVPNRVARREDEPVETMIGRCISVAPAMRYQCNVTDMPQNALTHLFRRRRAPCARSARPRAHRDRAACWCWPGRLDLRSA